MTGEDFIRRKYKDRVPQSDLDEIAGDLREIIEAIGRGKNKIDEEEARKIREEKEKSLADMVASCIGLVKEFVRNLVLFSASFFFVKGDFVGIFNDFFNKLRDKPIILALGISLDKHRFEFEEHPGLYVVRREFSRHELSKINQKRNAKFEQLSVILELVYKHGIATSDIIEQLASRCRDKTRRFGVEVDLRVLKAWLEKETQKAQAKPGLVAGTYVESFFGVDEFKYLEDGKEVSLQQALDELRILLGGESYSCFEQHCIICAGFLTEIHNVFNETVNEFAIPEGVALQALLSPASRQNLEPRGLL